MSASKKGRRLVVGINRSGYNERRNFLDLPLARYRHLRSVDLYSAWSWLMFRTTGGLEHRYLNAFRDGDLGRYDLIHLFNGSSYGKRPWVTTFETRLPRWGACTAERTREGFRLMAADPCRRLIALSECTARIQRHHVNESGLEFAEALDRKLMVMHPAQPLLWNTSAEKPPIEQGVRFAFVGHDLFRKGGMEMLDAFAHLYDTGKRNWHLTIISKMAWGDYASRTEAKDLDRAMRTIQRLPTHIEHHRSLENHAVLAVLQRSHAGLLPSWADTYGYSVLECQASGCPVITTDIRALPEINNDRVGWLLPVAKDELGMGLILGEHREQFRNSLLDGLISVLEGILLDPGQLISRRDAALERIASDHDPVLRAKELEGVYDAALGHDRSS